MVPMVMDTTEMAKLQQRYRSLMPAKLALFSIAISQAPFGVAADWRIEPTLSLRETYTDNVNNATRGNEKSDFVTEISPGVNVTATGRRLKLDASYIMRNQLYANGGQGSTVVNDLNGTAFAELVDDLIFLDATANMSRQNLSAFGPQSSNNSYSNTNQTNLRNLRVSPFARYRFGNTANTELRYTHTATSSSTAGFSNAQTDAISARVDSGTSFYTLGWGLRFDKANTHYTESESQQSQSQGGNLRYRVNNQFSLTGTGGYESFSYQTDGEKPEGKYWSTGFIWAPSERTTLEASVGRRYYGTSYALNAANRSRYVTSTVTYSEDITTAQEQYARLASNSTSSLFDQLFQSSIPDAAVRQQAVEAFIRTNNLPSTFTTSVNSLTNRVFLQKRAQASLAFNASKTAVVFSAFNSRREAQSGAAADAALLSANNFLLDSDNRTSGVSGFVTVRASSYSTLNLSASVSRTDSLNTDRSDNNKILTLGLSTQFQPKLRGTIEVRRNQNTSNEVGSSLENAISAYLSMQL